MRKIAATKPIIITVRAAPDGYFISSSGCDSSFVMEVEPRSSGPEDGSNLGLPLVEESMAYKRTRVKIMLNDIFEVARGIWLNKGD
jgi:hypothetical protein